MSADFDTPEMSHDEDAPRLMLDLAGYEGPLDLMLDLARREKIDITAISILTLAEQFLAFIAQAKALKLEIAADYLVMAAWLAWLKSRMLLPKAEDDPAPAGEELAEDLARRLERLAAFRKAGEMLGARLDLQRESFPRGQAETTLAERMPTWQVSLTELLGIYGQWRLGEIKPRYHVVMRRTLSIAEARAVLERMVGQAAEWCPLALLVSMLEEENAEKADARSATASGFVAALEMAREGKIALKQESPFAPLYLKASTGEGAP